MNRYFDLYLTAGHSVPVVINANQYDSSETWIFTLYTEDDQLYTPASGSIVGLKSDGHTIANAGTVNNDGQVVIQETVQITAAKGINVFELVLDGNHGTANFVVLVEPRPGDNVTPSDSELTLMEQAIAAAGSIEAVSVLQETVNSVAGRMDEFISSHAGLANETILWEGTLGGTGSVTLSEDASTFDTIAVYTQAQSNFVADTASEAHYFKASDLIANNAIVTVAVANTFSQTSPATAVISAEVGISGTQNKTFDLIAWKNVRWSGVATDDAEIAISVSGAVIITKVVGIKNEQADTEVLDARVGADGTIYSNLEQRLNAENAALKSALYPYNARNLLGAGESKTVSNLVWTRLSDGSMNVNGTAGSAASFNYLAGDTEASYMPDGFRAGNTYHLEYTTTDTEIATLVVRIEFYNGSTFISRVDIRTTTDFTIPANATGMHVYYRVSANATINNVTVKAVIMNALTNEELTELIQESTTDGKVLRLTVPTANISAGADLNTYLTAGQYRVPNATTAGSIQNIPQARAGQLIVMYNNQYTDTVKTVTQIYVANGGTLYVRYYALEGGTGTFTAWEQIAYTSAIDDVRDDAVNLVTEFRPALDTNDDLNDFLTPGQWRVPSQAKAKSLKNKPRDFAATGLFTVFNTHNTNHVYQVIATNSNTNMWIRHIRIDIEQYDEWKSIVTAEDGLYSWQKAGFLIHSPNEESADMIEVFDKYLNREITDSTVWATRTNGFRDVSSADVYALWDALQAEYPDYIDEGETIGYSLDTTGANYQPVKAYYIHPRLVDGLNRTIEYDAMPTIYLTAGTHGVEASPAWNLFSIFRRAFVTGTIYTEFLNGTKFRVVPVLSRWSYDHYKRYLAAAYNADGTQRVPDEDLELYDANRMCICVDDTNPTYASLNIPAYATEAKALTKYLNDHNFGAVSGDSYLDLHNCSYSLGYMTSDKASIRVAFNKVVDALAKDWMMNTTWANGDPVDYYNGNTEDHTVLNGKILGRESVEHSYAWFFEKAYNSFTSNILEVQQYDGVSCNKFAIAKGLDMTYRWLRYVSKYIRIPNGNEVYF